MAILHLLLSITETSAPYNEHCLAASPQRDVAICTYFKSNMAIPRSINLFEGDGSLSGFFRALKAAFAAKDYAIIHAHSPHLGFLLVAAAMFAPEKFMPGSVYTVHNSYQNYKLRNQLLMITVFAFFRRVVCCSAACFESLPGFFKWLARNRLCVVPNGLDLDRVDRVIRHDSDCSSNGNFTLGVVGRLIEIKNPLTALRAFRQTNGPASRLVFIGEGHLRDALMTEIQASGLAGRIELTGLIPRDQVFEKLRQTDLVISASRGEGLPVAVIEAMACRCPVILSDIPPHREIVGSADFIPLIHPDDVLGMACEIERYRQMPAATRAQIGEKCRKLVEARFSLAAMHQEYEKIYAQVTGKIDSDRSLRAFAHRKTVQSLRPVNEF